MCCLFEMHKEIQYRNITIYLSIYLVFSLFIKVPNNEVQHILDLIHELVALIAVIFACLWLRKKIMILGLLIYILAFNYDLLFNPLFLEKNIILGGEPDFFNFKVNVLSYIFIMAGLFDFDDKFFRRNLKLSLVTILVITLLFSLTFQIIVRHFIVH